MPRPPVANPWGGDWYAHDPCTNWKVDPHWYAPDLIDLIQNNETGQEIGSHSFSHIDFSEDKSTPELVRRELEACAEVMRPSKGSFRSLVYPFNNMGHHYLDIIADYGVTSVRHRSDVRLSYPERSTSGVYKLSESMNLRRSKYYDYIEKARIFLEEAMRHHFSYHIWFHPSDPTEVFEREFYGIVRLMADLRAQGKLWVATMADLAAYCEARERTRLEVQRGAKDLSVRFTTEYDAARYGDTCLTLKIDCDFEPTRVQFRADGKAQNLSWRSNGLMAPNGHCTSLLVDVPAHTKELVVQS
jgi:hypothetical protein